MRQPEAVGARTNVLRRCSRQRNESILCHGVKSILEWQVHINYPGSPLPAPSVRIEDFPIAAAATESEYPFMWIAMRVSRFHHPLEVFRGIAGVAARFMVESGRRDRLFDRQMAATHSLLIEHHLVRNVRRTLIPVRIFAIELNGQDGPRADIGAPPLKASTTEKFEANMEIGVLHKA